MLLTTQRARLSLADDEIARLNNACDARLEVTRGHVWLTIEGEAADIVLCAGQRYVVESTAPVTLSALRGAAAVQVQAGAQERRAACRPVRVRRLRQALARFSLSAERWS